VSEASAPAALTLSDAIASLLRLQVPGADAPADAADACLKRFECGGYLYHRWRAAGRLRDLPQGWAAALARAHRKTMVDNLQALAEFRVVARLLTEEGAPFVLLKGGAYLIDLYDDPGERMLTDIDLLVRRSDLGRLARRLSSAGFEAVFADEEYRRFEVAAPNPNGCHFEFHWWLGLPLRVRISQEEIWSRSIPAVLDGVSCRRLAPEDALLYHVAHQADHYFGPSLKWTIDLQQMLRVWKPDVAGLLRRAADWRLRIALDLGLRHLDKLFPGVAPHSLRDGAAVGAVRGRLLRLFLASDPVLLFDPSSGMMSRYLLRCLLIDRPIDALAQALRVMVRPIANRIGRGAGADPHWDASD
jgi:putative nucleotidyltransferase-like protein